MMKLLDRSLAGGSTLYPRHISSLPSLRAAEDFYLQGGGNVRYQVEIRLVESDGSLKRTWLTEHIEEQMNTLLRLRDGWDGRRARALTLEAVDTAVRMVFDVADDLSFPPLAFPLPDGGVQLEWHAGSAYVEIEVTADGTSHALAGETDGTVLIDQEQPSHAELEQIREAVSRLSRRIAGARNG